MDGVNNPATLDSAREEASYKYLAEKGLEKNPVRNNRWPKSLWASRPLRPADQSAPVISARISIQMEADSSCIIKTEPVASLFARRLNPSASLPGAIRISAEEARTLYETLDARFGPARQKHSFSVLTGKLARKLLPQRLPQVLSGDDADAHFWLEPASSNSPEPEAVLDEASAEPPEVDHALDCLYPAIPEFVRLHQVRGEGWGETSEGLASGSASEEIAQLLVNEGKMDDSAGIPVTEGMVHEGIADDEPVSCVEPREILSGSIVEYQDEGIPKPQPVQNNQPIQPMTPPAEELLMISPDILTAIVRKTRSAWKDGLEPRTASATQNEQGGMIAHKAVADKTAPAPDNPLAKLDEVKLHMIRTVQLNSTLINYFADRYFATNEPI